MSPQAAGGHPPAYEPVPRTPSPETLTAKPSKKHASCSDTWASIMLSTWLWEAVAMIFSMLCFAAIVGVLRAFDQKSRPSFAYGLTLNAIISILATASKSSLIYVIGECMGQLKWIWFCKEGKQLDGMQLFDSASRGPLGSLFIILDHKGQSLASLGALLMILALIYDPFVQQIITYPTRETADTSDLSRALAKQAFYVDPDLLSAEREDTDVANVVYTGVWTESSDYLQPRLTCSSGNCRWPTYRSVGMCSKCEDITSTTTFECGANGPIETPEPEVTYEGCSNSTSHESCTSISTTTSLPTSYTDCSITTSKRDSLNATLDFFLSTLPDGTPRRHLTVPEHIVWSPYEYQIWPHNKTYVGIRDPQFVAIHTELGLASNKTTGYSPLSHLGDTLEVKRCTQCALALCLQTYDISVSNGTASFDIGSTDYGGFFYNSHPDQWGNNEWCWRPESSLAPSLVNIPTEPDAGSVYANKSEFAFFFKKWYMIDDYLTRVSRSQSDSPNVDKIINTGLEAVMANVAASFTKAALTASNGTVTGTAYVSEVYVSVDWVLLILPAALVALGIVLLGLTVFVNRRRKLPLWKSSLLAVLFHGLNGFEAEDADASSRTETADQMEKVAQGITVRLRAVDEQRGLMLDRS
ncbi:DUF3176 domain-containing protein [Aspergillus mulundensis]|uniref:Uncharacterized protein n=1 Tax=Aspergillus mulundensis TaxID=1810919 RepID=A0A3D8REV1_9EURO|nr:hypothetical protein DSM5745_07563 [Aspergillus mulundensis]RDW72391.1 hypothetical protein DSM5745_07563 [Aspergillus mulundensis]